MPISNFLSLNYLNTPYPPEWCQNGKSGGKMGWISVLYQFVHLCLANQPHLKADLQHTDDHLLFSRIAEGDEVAFTSLYTRYVPALAQFIDTLIRSSAVTDEIVQETFLRLWISRDKLLGIHSPKAWIFRIAANICYTYLKRLLMEKEIVGQLHQRNAVGDIDQLELVHVKGMLSALEEGVHQLSPQRRKIYQLSREQGLSATEIAETLSLSIQTVRNTLSSSLEQLRSFLIQKGYSIALTVASFFFF